MIFHRKSDNLAGSGSNVGIQTEDNAAVTDFFFARMHPDDWLRVEQAYREAHVEKS